MIWSTPATLLLLVFPLAAGGCASSAGDTTTAGSATDAVEATHSEGQLLSTFTDFGVMPATGKTAATLGAGRVTAGYAPAGCATAAIDGATVTYTFGGCDGPRGLFGVKGTVTVVYAVDATAVETQVSASGLKVDGAVLDALTTQGDFEVDGTTHRLSEESTAQATGRLGTAFERQGSYALAWSAAQPCLALSGAWSTTTEAKARTTTVSNYDRCSSHCPAVGAEIDYAGPGTDSLSIAFDGSSDADWSTSTGKHGKIDLECTE